MLMFPIVLYHVLFNFKVNRSYKLLNWFSNALNLIMCKTILFGNGCPLLRCWVNFYKHHTNIDIKIRNLVSFYWRVNTQTGIYIIYIDNIWHINRYVKQLQLRVIHSMLQRKFKELSFQNFIWNYVNHTVLSILTPKIL